MIARTSRLTLSDFLPFHGKHKKTGQRAGPINSCFGVGAVDNSFANMSWLAMVSYLVSQYTSSLYKFVKFFLYYLSARIIIFIGVVSSHSISLY